MKRRLDSSMDAASGAPMLATYRVVPSTRETTMKWLLAVLAICLHPAYAHDATQERNKQAVLDFYDKGLNQKDFAAASKHFGATYIQHNPNAADGPDGF